MYARILSLMLIVALAWSCGGDDDKVEKVCPKVICGDYLSQQAAQAVYDSDTKCYKNLDPDGDGVACANLPSAGTGTGTGTGTGGCPTTSNCGCSGKNKSDCSSNCCKWTVGSGCGCK